MKKNIKRETIILITICMMTAGITMILIGLVLQINYSAEKERCYNLPPDEFYKDKSCLKYVEKK